MTESREGDHPDRLIDPQSGLEVLWRSECLAHLHEEEVGRIGFADGADVHVLPVNYVMEGDEALVFRTAAGAKFEAGARGAAVAFEIDGLDADDHVGWSVVVHGHGHVVAGPAGAEHDLSSYELRRLSPWARSPKSHWIRVELAMVTGVRIRTVWEENLADPGSGRHDA